MLAKKYGFIFDKKLNETIFLAKGTMTTKDKDKITRLIGKP
jgi:hypothetical protein